MTKTVKERDAKIQMWYQVSEQLGVLKEQEAKLRKEVISYAYDFNENETREGTENIELANGYKLKAVFKMNHNLSTAKGKVEAMISELAASGPEGHFVAKRLVNFKPSLQVKEYKNLPPNLRKIVDKVITTKSAMPSLSIVEPKA